MLESHSVLVRPWVANPPAKGGPRPIRTRPIHEVGSGQPLGIACEMGLVSRWWNRFAWPTLEVYENLDQSLLLTVERNWTFPPSWEVRDADHRTVGFFTRKILLDSFSQVLARIANSGNVFQARFLAADGWELGTLTRTSQGMEVRYALELEEKPLVKMVMLAAVLRQDQG